jgi:hypothetical protein
MDDSKTSADTAIGASAAAAEAPAAVETKEAKVRVKFLLSYPLLLLLSYPPVKYRAM